MYKLKKDIAGYNGFGLPFSDQKYSASLAATTDTTLTVPSGSALGAPLNTVNKFLAVITVEDGGDVWIANGATAAVPAGATFATTTSELIVGGEYFAREVNAGDVLHFYTATGNTDVSVVFYCMPAS